MKKNLLIALILMAISEGTIAQRKIKYIFSDEVESAIDSCLSIREKYGHGNYFYLLLSSDSSIYSLSVGEIDTARGSSISLWVEQTSRYALINARLIPLIFDYDLTFSTTQSEMVGTFQNREGEIVRARILLHGFIIYFDRFGHIIRKVT